MIHRRLDDLILG